MIRVQCPHCEKRYRTELEACGKTAVCTKCSQTFRIGESRPPFEWNPVDLEDSWIGVAPPEQKEELKHCIICDAPLTPGAVRCLACGANQVTGVVHRPRPQLESHRTSVGTVLPLRLVVIIAIFGAIAAGGYWAILAISRGTAKMTDQLIDERLAGNAAAALRKSGDERAVAVQFRGKVTDVNLPRFVQMLSAGDSGIRRAAATLIGAGTVTDLGPVLEWVRKNPDTERELHVLAKIGSRRLIELSGSEDSRVRQSAAEALVLLEQLPPEPATLEQLAAAGPAGAKVHLLNTLTRPWPEAVGVFPVVVNETTAPFTATIEQIGRTFYLKLGGYEFASVPGKEREFEIPIEYWSAATAPAVDPARAREQLAGKVTLASPFGIGWEGLIDARVKRDPRTLPGFLPVPTPTLGQAISAPVRLQRR